MKRTIRIAASLILLSLILMGATSCIIDVNPSQSHYVPESLVGTWTSGYIYDNSDQSYDYAHLETLGVTSNGELTVIKAFYMKDRTGSTWVKNYSKPSVQARYELYGYEYSETDGYLTIFDVRTFDTVARPDYRLSGSGKVLLLTFENGTTAQYAKVADATDEKV